MAISVPGLIKHAPALLILGLCVAGAQATALIILSYQFLDLNLRFVAPIFNLFLTSPIIWSLVWLGMSLFAIIGLIVVAMQSLQGVQLSFRQIFDCMWQRWWAGYRLLLLLIPIVILVLVLPYPLGIWINIEPGPLLISALRLCTVAMCAIVIAKKGPLEALAMAARLIMMKWRLAVVLVGGSILIEILLFNIVISQVSESAKLDSLLSIYVRIISFMIVPLMIELLLWIGFYHATVTANPDRFPTGLWLLEPDL